MSDLQTLWLPLSVAALTVLALLVDAMSIPSASTGRTVGGLVIVGLAATLVASFFINASGTAAHGVYEASAWTVSLQRLFLAAGVIAALGGIDHVTVRAPGRAGEYWMLLLSSITGMALLAGARDLILLVVSFELMGIPLYVLASFAKTDVGASGVKDRRPSEAGLKLYLVGATSTAVTLFGLALLTGMTGTTRLDALAATQMQPLATLGAVLMLAGFGYKVGVVPFHMWVPDTYQGAWTPFVAFLSVAPKAAGVAALSQVFVFGLGAQHERWLPALMMLSFLSMAVGNLLALPQTDVRRLLGYSGIAQMGYALLGVAAIGEMGAGMTLFFLTSYVFTNMGAFLVLHAVAEGGGSHDLDGLRGLSSRAPGLAAALLCFLLSLAGIPFVVGFWAKLYVFLAAWHAGLVSLVVAGVALAALGIFYYLQVLRAAYMTDARGLEGPTMTPALKLAIGLCLAAVVGFGLWPGPLVESSARAAHALLSHGTTLALSAR